MSKSPHDYTCFCNKDEPNKFCVSPFYLALLLAGWVVIVLFFADEIQGFLFELLVHMVA